MLKYKICCAVSISGRELMSHSFYYIATKCACSNNCMTQMTQICDSIELFLPYGMEILHARTVDYFCLLGFWPSGAKTLRGQLKHHAYSTKTAKITWEFRFHGSFLQRKTEKIAKEKRPPPPPPPLITLTATIFFLNCQGG